MLHDGEHESFNDIRQGMAMVWSDVSWECLPMSSIVLEKINKRVLDCDWNPAIPTYWRGDPLH